MVYMVSQLPSIIGSPRCGTRRKSQIKVLLGFLNSGWLIWRGYRPQSDDMWWLCFFKISGWTLLKPIDVEVKGVGSRIGLPDQPFLWHLWTRSLLPGLLLHWAACQHRSFLVLLPGREAWIVEDCWLCDCMSGLPSWQLVWEILYGKAAKICQDAQGLNKAWCQMETTQVTLGGLGFWWIYDLVTQQHKKWRANWGDREIRAGWNLH